MSCLGTLLRQCKLDPNFQRSLHGNNKCKITDPVCVADVIRILIGNASVNKRQEFTSYLNQGSVNNEDFETLY